MEIEQQNQQPIREASVTSPNTIQSSQTFNEQEPLFEQPTDDEANEFTDDFIDGEEFIDQDFFSSLPPGYRFCPMDGELIVYYLKKKIAKEVLPRHQIRHINLYRHSPDKISERYPPIGEKEWYFFTPRHRKYRNGSRPNRAAGFGYWKATGADKPVKYNGSLVGYRKALVYYQGKPPKGDKTNWIMHEYRVDVPPRKKTSPADMRLDKFVLCRIYKKSEKSFKIRPRNEYPEGIDENGCPTPQGFERFDQNNVCPPDMLMDNKNDLYGMDSELYGIEASAGFGQSQYQSGFPQIPQAVDTTLSNSISFNTDFQQPLNYGAIPASYSGHVFPAENAFMPKYYKEGPMDTKQRGVQGSVWSVSNYDDTSTFSSELINFYSGLDYARAVNVQDIMVNLTHNPSSISPFENSKNPVDIPPTPKRS